MATLLLLLVALLVPGGSRLPAQPPAAVWRMEMGSASTAVAEVQARGFAALPLSALVSAGGAVSFSRDGVSVHLGAEEIRFRIGSVEVESSAGTRRLAHAVYQSDGVLLIPVEFFIDVLPTLAAASLRIDPSNRTIRRLDSRSSAAKPAGAGAVPEAVAPVLAGSPKPPPQRRLVVVDAGHGGVDPGAHGPGGAREKTITLAVARRVAALLREDPTLEVRMTRDRDTLIALRDRTRFANRWREGERPALFISIHCNANPARSARGFETYFLSEAKTEDARRVAAMENAAQEYEEKQDRSGDPLSFIFNDLRQNKYLRDSSDWAALIQDRLDEVLPGPNRGVKQAGFAVLNGAFMPAVLVEIGFISNPREEEMLTSAEYQVQIAQQLARSVRDFFSHSPSVPRS